VLHTTLQDGSLNQAKVQKTALAKNERSDLLRFSARTATPFGKINMRLQMHMEKTA
jgi:hypothetical protein